MLIAHLSNSVSLQVVAICDILPYLQRFFLCNTKYLEVVAFCSLNIKRTVSTFLC